jgi:hypothetical protein
MSGKIQRRGHQERCSPAIRWSPNILGPVRDAALAFPTWMARVVCSPNQMPNFAPGTNVRTTRTIGSATKNCDRATNGRFRPG